MANKQPPTYQELVAEAYDENAKDQLVYDQYIDEENDDVDAYDAEKYEENELKDPDDFNKIQGDRNDVDQVIQPKPNPNEQGKSSYAYDRDIRVNSVNIDGRFREVTAAPLLNSCDPAGNNFATGTTSNHFLVSLSRQFKNVTSVKVTSLEITNSFYTFSVDRENISFFIESSMDPPNPDTLIQPSYIVTIDEGNYAIADFIAEVQAKIRAVVTPLVDGKTHFSSFTIWQNPRTLKLVFSCDNDFTMKFPQNSTTFSGNGIGYNMGFYRLVVLSTMYPPNPTPNPAPGNQENFLVADVYPDVVQDVYIYLRVNDWYAVRHQYPGQTELGAFLKVPITVPKGQVQFDNISLDAGDKEYFFPQPVNIQTLELNVIDSYGNDINMQGGGFSITLAIREVLQASIYEKMLQL